MAHSLATSSFAYDFGRIMIWVHASKDQSSPSLWRLRKDSAMNASYKLWAKGFQGVIAGLLLCLFSAGGARAQNFLTVDCTGTTPGAYSSLQSAVYSATPWTFILVTGPCNENLSIYAQTNLNLGAYYGQ